MPKQKPALSVSSTCVLDCNRHLSFDFLKRHMANLNEIWKNGKCNCIYLMITGNISWDVYWKYNKTFIALIGDILHFRSQVKVN